MALWGHLQSTGADSGSGTSVGLAFGSNITGGSILIVAARFGGTGQNPGCTDDKSNTYVRIHSFDSNTEHFAIWYALNAAAGATTVTITNATSVTRRWVIHEYDAASTTITADQSANATGSSTAVSSGATGTRANASELVFCAACVSGAATFTAGTNLTFTKRQEIIQKIASEDAAPSSAGTEAGTFSISVSDTWGAGVVTFKSTAATGDTQEWRFYPPQRRFSTPNLTY